MKRILALIALVVCLLCGCNGGREAKVRVVKNEKTLLVLFVEETQESKSLFDALCALQEEGEIAFSYEEGEFGAYLLSFNGRTLSGKEYWAVYTTLEEYGDKTYSSTDFGTFEYGENTLNSASYGVSGLPLIAGNYYAIKLATY